MGQLCFSHYMLIIISIEAGVCCGPCNPRKWKAYRRSATLPVEMFGGNQVGMLGDMSLWLVANLKQGVIYFIKQALPPNKSAGSVPIHLSSYK